MLLNIRETVRNSKPIKYTLITIICIPFALVGIGSYFSGGSAPPVAEVNGTEILPTQLESAYSQQRSRLAQMFGGNIPPGFADENVLREQALEQLITQQVVRSEVENQAFAVGDETLGRAIRNIPNFQVDGQFDSETYQRFLQGSGLSVDGFEQQMRDDTAIEQFRAGIAATSFTLPAERQRTTALAEQVRVVDIVQFDIAEAKNSIEVADEDIQTYFDENADSYQFPERAKLAYVALNSASLAEDIDIPDDDAKDYYDDNRSSYITPESRAVSHIMLTLDDPGDADAIAEKTATLVEIKARLGADEDFAALAKEFSEDIGSAENGGDLGVVAPGLMEPAFETAAYELGAVGDISEPIVTTYGVSTMKRNQADEEFFNLREALTELAFDNPDGLDIVAEDTGLEVVTTDWVDSTVVASSTDSVIANPAVLTAALTDDVLLDGNNSEIVELGPNHVVTVRVLEHEGPRPKSLDDVREDILDTLKTERAGEQLDSLASSMLEKINAGEAVKDLAEGDKLASATVGEELDRQSTALERAVVADVFALPTPSDSSPITHQATLASGDRVAVVLRQVNTPEADAEDANTDTAQIFNPQLGGTEFNAMVESIRSRADVTVNDINSVYEAAGQAAGY